MNHNSALYFKAAKKLKFSCFPCPQIDGFQIHLGSRRYLFRGSITPFNSASSAFVTENKYCMNKLLEANGLPVPKAVAYKRQYFEENDIEALIANLQFPLVVKPTSRTACGLDVLCNITEINQLKDYMTLCYQNHEIMSIEEFHKGLNSYRVLMFYQKVIGVVQRFSARITGDGEHSIEELIVIENKVRTALAKSVTLGPLKIDLESLICLKEVGMTPKSIPKEGEVVLLCYTCNSTRGGTMQSLGKQIGKENAQLLSEASRILDLNLVGFDVLCEDILEPLEKSGGKIIEANYNPDITIHEHPIMGVPNPVSEIILKRLIKKHPLAFCLGVFEGNH